MREAALKYKELWRVGRRFREAKSLSRTCPVDHRRGETIRGHAFCSFLVLLLMQELGRRAGTWRGSWLSRDCGHNRHRSTGH